MPILHATFVAGIDSGGAGPFQRGRLLFWGALTASTICWTFLVSRVVLQPQLGPEHAVMLVAAVLLAGVPVVMRASGSYRLAAHFMVGSLLVLMTLDSWAYGGLGAPAAFGFLVLPVMATFFLGRRATIGYTVLIVLTVAGLAAVSLAGLARPSPLEFGQHQIAQLLALIGMLVFIAVASGAYDAEHELSRARTSALVDNLADGVVAVDVDGSMVVNPALRRLLQLPPGGDLPFELSRLIAAATEEIVRGELRLPGGVGSVVASPIRFRGPVGDLAGGAVAIVRDITLEREIDRMKTNFISTVSHELRTPLTSVLGFAKVTRSKLEGSVFPHVPEDDPRSARALHQARANLDIIISEGERLSSLINDLLDIAKMEVGRMDWSMEVVDLAAVVRQAIDATGGLFADGEVALVHTIPEVLPQITGDHARLVQVLINLISNAAKFTAQGSVHVSAEVVVGAVELVVHDTGQGIAPEDQDRVFDRFQQLGQAEGRAAGTGLGLPICREILLAHQGTIQVESAVGLGARFIVSLPS